MPIFTQALLSTYFSPPISIKTNLNSNEKFSFDCIMECSRAKKFVSPKSFITKTLLAEQLPPRELISCKDNILNNKIPSFSIKSAPSFNLIDSLNDTLQVLQKENFKQVNRPFEKNDLVDTVLSDDSLNELMSFYAKANQIHTYTFQDQITFIDTIPEFEKITDGKDIACLVYLDKFKRHVTGFYIKLVNGQLTAYIFDTMGLTLPGEPCGHRYTEQHEQVLFSVLNTFEANKIGIAIMPLNMTIAMQQDAFSCLMATLLFFEGMQKNAYHHLECIGITACFGWSAVEDKLFTTDNGHCYKVPLAYMYTCDYLPLLIGYQNRLALLITMDEVTQHDYSAIISFMTDWQRNTGNDHSINAFWQICYVELLKWFEVCLEEGLTALPDFEKLAKNGFPNREEKSAFEESLIEIENHFGSKPVPSLVSTFHNVSFFAQNTLNEEPPASEKLKNNLPQISSSLQ